MPMELLRALSKRDLPCTLTEEQDIDRLRVLRAAEYVAALLPNPGSSSKLGRVLAITGLGRRALLEEDNPPAEVELKRPLKIPATAMAKPPIRSEQRV